MGLRDNLFESAPRLARHRAATGLDGEEAARLTAEVPDTRPRHHRSGRSVVVSHLRGVRGGVPGGHRARRHHRRDAPLRGAHGVALPERGGAHAPQHREPGRPLGPRRGQADGVDRGTRLRGPGRHRHHSRRHRVPLLGGLRRRPRRTRAQGDPGHGPAAAPGRGALRHPGARGSPAPGTPPAGSATSTSTRRWARPTSPPWTRSAPRRWWPPAPIASIPSHASTPTWAATSRSSTTRSCSAISSQTGRLTLGIDAGHGHLPRPLLPRPAQPDLRRAPQRPRLDRRGGADRDAPVPREELLLRGGWGPDVDGGEDRQAGQPRTDRRGAHHRGGRGVDGLSLLPDHARRRGPGPSARGRRPCPGSLPGARDLSGRRPPGGRPARPRISPSVERLGVGFAEALGHGHQELVGQGRHGVEEAVEPTLLQHQQGHLGLGDDGG